MTQGGGGRRGVRKSWTLDSAYPAIHPSSAVYGLFCRQQGSYSLWDSRFSCLKWKEQEVPTSKDFRIKWNDIHKALARCPTHEKSSTNVPSSMIASWLPGVDPTIKPSQWHRAWGLGCRTQHGARPRCPHQLPKQRPQHSPDSLRDSESRGRTTVRASALRSFTSLACSWAQGYARTSELARPSSAHHHWAQPLRARVLNPDYQAGAPGISSKVRDLQC